MTRQEHSKAEHSKSGYEVEIAGNDEAADASIIMTLRCVPNSKLCVARQVMLEL